MQQLPITLPKHVIALVHHIQLNESGWWELAIKRLIIASLWSVDQRLSVSDVRERIQHNFSVQLQQDRIESLVKELVEDGTLVPMGGQAFKISEKSITEFEKEVQHSEEIEERARSKWRQILSEYCLDISADKTFDQLNDTLLIPTIKQMGAKVYEMLSGQQLAVDKLFFLEDFLSGFPSDLHPALRKAIISFLNPKNRAARQYVLSMLNAFFFVIAGNLSSQTLQKINQSMNKRPIFKIFVDTNFLLSVLGLHDNPSNEAAQSLITLIAEISDNVSVSFHILPHTVDELRRTLQANLSIAKSLRIAKNIPEVITEMHLSGIIGKYLEVRRSSPLPVGPDEYFGPYVKNPIATLRSKGVDLYNEKIDSYKKRQDVVDDILSQLDYLQVSKEEQGKLYTRWEHDMIMWHFVQDKRPSALDSPIEAVYWVATVDFGFLGFDRYKQGTLNGIPICLHPTGLIQMLQFWVPRDERFEEVILGNMRLPLLFKEFDPEAEEVSIRILRHLSRYENVQDLSQETIKAILLNEVLRQRMTGETRVEEEIELVKDALIEQLEVTQKEAEELERMNKEKSSWIKKLRERISQLENNEHKTQEEFRKERRRRSKVEQKVNELKTESQQRDMQNKARDQRSAFLTKWGLIGFLSTSVSMLAGFWGARLGQWSTTLAMLTAFALSSLLLVWLVNGSGQRIQAVQDWHLFARLQKCRKRILYILGLIIIGIIVDVIVHAFFS